MSNVVSSAIFCARNVDKTEKGHIGRAPVAAGQAINVFKNVVSEVQKYDGKVGKTTKTAVDALNKAVKNDKVLEVAGKGVKILSKGVNPLICVSGGIDVLMADDKQSALIENSASLAAMFTVEKLMKSHLDKGLSGVAKIARKLGFIDKMLSKVEKGKHGGKVAAIVYGTVFGLGSCTGYAAGSKFGTLVAKKVRNAQGKEYGSTGITKNEEMTPEKALEILHKYSSNTEALAQTAPETQAVQEVASAETVVE